MYFGDHSPPHFHVITRSDERVSVAIDSLEIRAGSADPRDLAEALEWAAAHREQLQAVWSRLSEENE